MNKVVAVIGARPQFIKHFPFELEAKKHFDLVTIHTGQHYDVNMSQVFFDQLNMRKPDYMLSLGGGTHGVQTGKMLVEIEKILIEEKPDMVVVYGDTNSTLAGALAAAKLHIPITHIEAGLRSFNKNMPEEVNRVLTDHISKLLLVPSSVAERNLENEGISEAVHIVGDIMKDLIKYAKENELLIQPNERDYYYMTLHRPYNVDKASRLKTILSELNAIGQNIIFPAHPRTINNIKKFGLEDYLVNINLIPPQGYFENLSYLNFSKGLITDSGGMQKEAYWLKKKCFTIRSETEWIETLEGNANTLIFENIDELSQWLLIEDTINFNSDLYGDGRAAKKIVAAMENALLNSNT